MTAGDLNVIRLCFRIAVKLTRVVLFVPFLIAAGVIIVPPWMASGMLRDSHSVWLPESKLSHAALFVVLITILFLIHATLVKLYLLLVAGSFSITPIVNVLSCVGLWWVLWCLLLVAIAVVQVYVAAIKNSSVY